MIVTLVNARLCSRVTLPSVCDPLTALRICLVPRNGEEDSFVCELLGTLRKQWLASTFRVNGSKVTAFNPPVARILRRLLLT